MPLNPASDAAAAAGPMPMCAAAASAASALRRLCSPGTRRVSVATATPVRNTVSAPSAPGTSRQAASGARP